jgi:tetratricopeptide (TPR) repeat protein
LFSYSLFAESKNDLESLKSKIDEYCKQGSLYLQQKQNDKALESFDKASEIIKNNNIERFNRSEKIKLFKDIGDGYFDLGKYSAAEKYYLNGVSLEKINSPKEMSVTLFELYDMLGLTYLKLKQYQKSREYFDELLEYSIKEYGSNSYYTGSNYIIIAHSYYHEGKYSDAEKYFLKGITILEKLEDKKAILVRVYIDTALTYRKQRNRKQTLKFLKKAQATLKKNPSLNPELISVIGDKIKKWSK